LPLGLHEVGAQHPLGLVLVMRSTEHPAVRFGRSPTVSDQCSVIDLQESALGAAHAVAADERALLAVPRVHGSPHCARDMPRIRTLRARPFGARPRRCAELLLLERHEQGVERAIEHLGQITGWVPMPQQRLRPVELVPRLLAKGP
jgi:endogenous inhibitor of DNA gyrase (YacG/DUF329 family)